MKRLHLQYPDKTIHEVLVESLGYNKDNNIYIMTYNDLSLNRMMVTFLEKTNQTFLKNPYLENRNDLYYNLESLNTSILPDYIACIHKDNTKAQIQEPPKQKVQKQAKFPVYRDNDTGTLFIPETLANALNIKGNTKIIVNNMNCVSATQKDIDLIINITKNQNIAYIPEYITIKLNRQINNQNNNKPTKTIIIYHDKINNKYYIKQEDRTNSNNKNNPQEIAGYTCYEINENELSNLKYQTVSVYGTKAKTISKGNIDINIVKINNEMYTPEKITTTIGKTTGKKIRVNGEIYILVTEEDLALIKKQYNDKNIDINIKPLKIAKKNNKQEEINSMLKENKQEDNKDNQKKNI